MKKNKNLDYEGVLKIVKSTIQPYTYPKISIKKISEKSDIPDLGLDSLDLVDFVIGLEEKLKVSIPDEDAEKFRYSEIGELTKYVQGLVKEKYHEKDKDFTLS